MRAQQKKRQFDFWTVNGSIDFGFMPTSLTDYSGKPIPIRLQRGNHLWGADHIVGKHGAWLKKQDMSAPEMVLTKLAHVGTVYSAEDANKLKISFVMSPTALLVLRYVEQSAPFFTVTTAYYKTGQLDGERKGKFGGCEHAQQHLASSPVFLLQQPTLATVRVEKDEPPNDVDGWSATSQPA